MHLNGAYKEGAKGEVVRGETGNETKETSPSTGSGPSSQESAR